jgi:hypothetical protein
MQLLDLIYRLGEPIRYSYLDHSLPLDLYQTVYASQPGSVEMPRPALHLGNAHSLQSQVGWLPPPAADPQVMAMRPSNQLNRGKQAKQATMTPRWRQVIAGNIRSVR